MSRLLRMGVIAGGASAPAPTFTGQVVEDLTLTDFYRTTSLPANHRPYPGTDPAVWYLVMIGRGENAASNTALFLATNSPFSAFGWGWSYNGSLRTISFHCTSGVRANCGPLISAEDGELVVFHCTMDSDGDLRGYRNGIRWDQAPQSTGTYQALGAQFRLGGVGDLTGGCAVNGYAFDAFLDDAGVEAHYQALLLDHAATFAGQEVQWVADDAGATWDDRISAIEMERLGAPTLTSVTDAPYRQRYDPSWTGDLTAHPSGALVNPHWLADGDSITVGVGATSAPLGYVGLSESRAALDVVGLDGLTAFNGGNSGSTVEDHEQGGVDDILVHISAESPDVVSVLLGTNNAPSAAGLATAKAAYPRLIEDVIAAGVTRLVLCTIPSLADAYSAATAIEFNRWLVNEYWPTISGITIHRCNMSPPGGASHTRAEFVDNAHPNNTGHSALADRFYPVLRAAAGYSP